MQRSQWAGGTATTPGCSTAPLDPHRPRSSAIASCSPLWWGEQHDHQRMQTPSANYCSLPPSCANKHRVHLCKEQTWKKAVHVLVFRQVNFDTITSPICSPHGTRPHVLLWQHLAWHATAMFTHTHQCLNLLTPPQPTKKEKKKKEEKGKRKKKKSNCSSCKHCHEQITNTLDLLKCQHIQIAGQRLGFTTFIYKLAEDS